MPPLLNQVTQLVTGGVEEVELELYQGINLTIIDVSGTGVGTIDYLAQDGGSSVKQFAISFTNSKQVIPVDWPFVKVTVTTGTIAVAVV